MENFFSEEIFSVDDQNLLNYHTNVSIKISSTRNQCFTLDFLMSQKTDPLESLLNVQIHMI